MSEAAVPVTTPLAREAVQPSSDPQWQAHLKRQQLQLLARQATRTPFAIVIACGFVAYTVRDYAPLVLVATWCALVLALLFSRRWYAQSLLADTPDDATPALKRLVVLSLSNGAMLGLGALLFFKGLPGEERALLTMIFVCWTAGAVATAAAYAPAFYGFVSAGLLPLAIMWGVPFDSENVAVGVLIVLFGLFQILFVRDNERVVCESFLIRFENERLLDALEKERQEVLLARDRAEDASRAKSRFLAAASHDLRQPLHALALYSGALSLRETEAGCAELVAQIDNTVNSLSALFESLLDISKLDAGAVKPELRRIDVSSSIDRMKSEFKAIAQEKGLEFLVSSSDATVETDPVLFERILRNLVDNAIKYTKEGTVELSTNIVGQGLRIAVTDTGPGIPDAERERIFEEFYQIGNAERDRRQGLGLGLALVRRLAKLLDIPLEMTSEPGKGSTFAVTLPRLARVITAEKARETPVAPAASGELAGAHVLVLDDEPAVRLGMRALLEVWGCHVTACSSYVEAERMIAQYALTIDVIVADFRLREHETGIDAVRKLRATLGDVPALLISGDTAPERLSEAQASGIPLLSKPVNPETLKERVKSVLRR
ncbi:MAG TPA: hybrid sensor histidine kinase/response regulator [Burkholderiales bacterium]|nr:hybrid sensor histidine kinase/response regulator [Burkholderiales bacterium]